MGNSIGKYKKKIIIFTIFFLISTITMPTKTFGKSLTDISNHWAKETIQIWLDKEFISGYPDGSFKPDNNITRAEFMSLVNKSFGYTETSAIVFSDVDKEAWYNSTVGIATKEGYIKGYPDGTLRPNNPISREEQALIIMKVKNLKPNDEAIINFIDSDKLTWSKDAVETVSKMGIMNGYPDGSFRPQKSLTRGESIVSLNRASKDLSSPPIDTVKDTVPPVLQLIGSNPAPTNLVLYPTVVPIVDSYADPGAIATDNLDGDITSSIIVTGSVITTKVGSYPLTYTVKDKAGNSTSLVRTVNVVGRMDPNKIPKFKTPLLIPWEMPKSMDPNPTANTDYYEIAMKQFVQQILPSGLPATTVWGFGSINTTDPNAIFHTPALTIEAISNSPTRIKWINGLVDFNNNYLPHLLPNDQTINSFPNLTGGMDHMSMQGNYVGPVPIVIHLHGAHVIHYSDGNPMAWYMPDSSSVSKKGYQSSSSFYKEYKAAAASGKNWTAGNSVFDYSNDQRADTLWYHDHTMGFTRTNVYAGGSGFYLIRGGLGDKVVNSLDRKSAILPGPAPSTKEQYLKSIETGNIYEVPLVIQDRTFNTDGSLWYPGSRAEFDPDDGYRGPYIPDTDIAPIWNPEFIGDTIMVNGNTWPIMNVQPKRYRLRFLNGSQARTFILKLDNITTSTNINFVQIGTDGGFISAPANLNQILMMPAERADVIVDFSEVAVGNLINLRNLGPDGPFQGGVPGKEDDEDHEDDEDDTFESADSDTTGLVMQFKVIPSDGYPDLTTPTNQLILPTIGTLKPTSSKARTLSLNEIMSTEKDSHSEMSVGPAEALLGTATVVNGVVTPKPFKYMDDLTELIKLNDTETWEIYNFTGDAHPIHLHLVSFQVVNRQEFDLDSDGETGTLDDEVTNPEVWETGYKDTVIAYPNQVLRIKAKFDLAGLYVWHCHILEHEDNEMMREFRVE